MSGTSFVTMGDRGRLVVPADVRERLHLEPGDKLILMEEDDGALLLISHAQLLARVRRDFAAAGDLVGELTRERRAAAAVEDAESR